MQTGCRDSSEIVIGEIHVMMDEQQTTTDSFYPADACIRNFKGENARRDELPPWGPVKGNTSYRTCQSSR
jgi:hypothetical protein